MTEIPILFKTKAARLPPCERLVVPETASVQADISRDRSHVADYRRGNGLGGLGHERIMLSEVVRVLDVAESGKRADLNAVHACSNAHEFADTTHIENILRQKQPLPHRGK